MSVVLQVGTQKIAAEEVFSVINKSQLLPQVLREVVVEKAIADISFTASELEPVYRQLGQQQQFRDASAQQQQTIAIRHLKLEKFKEENWGSKVKSYFLSRKEQLDKVVFSLIQANSAEIVQELYFRLQEGEEDFSQLAAKYSQGPEVRTGGLVGPIRLANLHSTLAKVLLASKVGELAPIFRVEKNFILVRLEKFIPCELDETLRQQLIDELFEKWLESKINQPSPPQKEQTINAPQRPINHYVASDQVAPVEVSPVDEDFLETEPDLTIVEEEVVEEEVAEAPLITQPIPSEEKTANKKSKLLIFCLLAAGLGGLVGLYFRQHPQLSKRIIDTANQPFKSNNQASSAEAFRVAVNNAMTAANLTQFAQSQAEWVEVSQYWQEAIAKMKAVKVTSSDYQIAQEKITEYQGYLDYAQKNANKASDPFHVAVNNAMQAANLTQSARSQAEWDTVASYWQQAIALMKAVANDSANYGVAITKVEEYRQYLQYARRQAANR